MASMNKPVPKREVAVCFAYLDVGHISFFSTEDAVTEFEQFGTVRQLQSQKNKYDLFIDARFDFKEVLAYIENYC